METLPDGSCCAQAWQQGGEWIEIMHSVRRASQHKLVILRIESAFVKRLFAARERKRAVRDRFRLVLGLWLMLSLVSSGTAGATGTHRLDLTPGYSQAELQRLVRETGLVISRPATAPAEAIGVTTLEASAELAVVHIHNSAPFWSRAITPATGPYLVLGRLQIQKGLPLGLEIGAHYTRVDQSEIAAAGANLKWTIVRGTSRNPAMALHTDYTRLVGISDLDLSVLGLDLSVSQGIGFLTPYVGGGWVWSRGREDTRTVQLSIERMGEPRALAGLRFSYLNLTLAVEAVAAHVPAASLRLSVEF